MKLLVRALVLPLFVLPTYACGDDEGGSDAGGSGSGSELPPSKPLEDLTEAEAERLCELWNEAASEYASASCILVGFNAGRPPGQASAETDQAACEAAVADCQGGGGADQPGTPPVACDGKLAVQQLEGCDATVSEFETCVRAGATAYANTLSQLDCTTDFQSINFDALSPTDENTSECDVMARECPQLDLGGDPSAPTVTYGPGCSDDCGGGNIMDGFCDDGGEGAITASCDLGTDCTDCGTRQP